MTYGIKFKKPAAKALKKVAKRDRISVRDKIASLADSLPDPKTTKLKGHNPFHRLRVGDYRIIYEIQNDCIIILVLKAGQEDSI